MDNTLTDSAQPAQPPGHGSKSVEFTASTEPDAASPHVPTQGEASSLDGTPAEGDHVRPETGAVDGYLREPRLSGWTIDFLERVRLILRGGSVIDWYRLGFETAEEVREFLEVNGHDVDDAADQQRVRALLKEAASYLRSELDLDVPTSLSEPDTLDWPFLVASRRSSDPKESADQRTACILLKLVHTMNHLEARELRLALALPEVEVFARVEARVGDSMRRLQQEGLPILRFDMSRKARDSTITKLLSKRRATAAQILDRLRFRVLVEQRSDIPSALAAMTRLLVPYNHVIPEESSNNLIDFPSFARSIPRLRPWLGGLQFRLDLEREDPLTRDFNECSADEFRMINFVVDVPVRVDDVVARPEHAHLGGLGRIVFVNAEFQIYDLTTWQNNERNTAASHDAYKARQKERVRERLHEGLERTWGNG